MMDSHIHEWEDIVWNDLPARQCAICGKVVWSIGDEPCYKSNRCILPTAVLIEENGLENWWWIVNLGF